MKTTLAGSGLIVMVLALAVAACNETTDNSWGWKRATEPEDVMNFLSKKPPYTQNITNAEVSAADKGSYIDYITFYQADPDAAPSGNWGWKRSGQPDDVMNFLNATPPYSQHIKQAEITAVDKGGYTDYIAFYQVDPAPGSSANWGWKRATDADDVINFLNKKPPYSHEIKEAEITAVDKGNYIDFIVFYQQGDSHAGSWGWKKAADENDVKDFLSGEGAYSTPVDKAEVVAVGKPGHSEYYVFYTR